MRNLKLRTGEEQAALRMYFQAGPLELFVHACQADWSETAEEREERLDVGTGLIQNARLLADLERLLPRHKQTWTLQPFRTLHRAILAGAQIAREWPPRNRPTPLALVVLGFPYLGKQLLSRQSQDNNENRLNGYHGYQLTPGQADRTGLVGPSMATTATTTDPTASLDSTEAPFD